MNGFQYKTTMDANGTGAAHGVCEHRNAHPVGSRARSLLQWFGMFSLECDECGTHFQVFDIHILLKNALWVAIMLALGYIGLKIVEFVVPTHPL